MEVKVFVRTAALSAGLVFAAAAGALAQGHATIRGRIVAAADESAIEGVRVMLAPDSGSSASEASSDHSGYFDFPVVAPGSS